jgi:ABC-type transport system substrate-binding protein/streptogramin lyase
VDVRVRVGIHTGEAAAAGERYVGFSVHRAARIGGAAHGGQILLSSSTRELVEDDLPTGVVLRDLGLWRLKDVDRPERVAQVVAEGLRSQFPSLHGAVRVRARVLRRWWVLAAALVGVVAVAVAVSLVALGSGSASSIKLPGDSLGSVDLASGHVVGSVALGASPNAVASGAGSIWVAMSNNNVVKRINPATNGIEQTIPVPGGPSAIAFGGGFVWVAESLAGTVAQIDPKTNGGQIVGRPIPVGNGPSGLAYGFRAVWVANSVDQTIVRINPHTAKTSRPISVDAGADAVAAGDGAVWVTGETAGVLSRVDPATGAVTTTNVGNLPVAVTTGPRAVWVANSGADTVDRVDPATGDVTGTATVGKAPNGVAAEPDGTVWVSNELSGSLSEIDPQTPGSPSKTVVVGGTPQGIALSGTTAFVPVQESPRAHRGGTLRVAIANKPGFYTTLLPRAFDPASGYGTWEITTMTNDGLLGYSRAGGAESYTVVPDLALALPTVSDAGRTYTFQLRRGIRYSTGALLQPADIRRGIERALHNRNFSPAPYLKDIVGAPGCLKSRTSCNLSRGIVTSSGARTVTFHLSSPDPDFLYQLALPVFDAVPASTPLKAQLPLPATGPYEIADYNIKHGIVRLKRNPYFQVWSAAAQPAGYPDRIVERYDYTGAAAVRAVEQGQADITADGLDQTWPAAVTKSLETAHSSQLYAVPILAVLGLWLNTLLPPFNDVRVRRALNYAVDRNRLAEINDGEVTCQILIPNTDGYRRYCPFTANPDATGTYHGPDLAKARELVAASGTKGQRVTVWFYDIPIGHRNGSYFVSVLRRLGYKAVLKTIPHEGPTWRPDRQAGVAGWAGDYPSANDIFSTTFTCGAYTSNPSTNDNVAGFCSPSIDREIARAAALQTTNPSVASARWSSIDRQITNQAPYVAIKLTLSTDFVSRGTGNYKYCWLAAETGLVGACLDQLWVR